MDALVKCPRGSLVKSFQCSANIKREEHDVNGSPFLPASVEHISLNLDPYLYIVLARTVETSPFPA